MNKLSEVIPLPISFIEDNNRNNINDYGMFLIKILSDLKFPKHLALYYYYSVDLNFYDGINNSYLYCPEKDTHTTASEKFECCDKFNDESLGNGIPKIYLTYGATCVMNIKFIPWYVMPHHKLHIRNKRKRNKMLLDDSVDDMKRRRTNCNEVNGKITLKI